MNKQLSAIMISLSLGIWLVTVFNISGYQVPPVQETSISVLSDLSVLPDLQFFEVGNHPEVPGFKVDWSLTGKLNSEFEQSSILNDHSCLTNTFFKKLVILFDIKIIFLHFFYPW